MSKDEDEVVDQCYDTFKASNIFLITFNHIFQKKNIIDCK